jgi:hypothetical protein
MRLQNSRKRISDQINALLLRPPADEDEQFRVDVLLEIGPFLRLQSPGQTLPFELLVDHGSVVLMGEFLVPRRSVGGIGVLERLDFFQTPEDGIPRVCSSTVFLRDSDSAETGIDVMSTLLFDPRTRYFHLPFLMDPQI